MYMMECGAGGGAGWSSAGSPPLALLVRMVLFVTFILSTGGIACNLFIRPPNPCELSYLEGTITCLSLLSPPDDLLLCVFFFFH